MQPLPGWIIWPDNLNTQSMPGRRTRFISSLCLLMVAGGGLLRTEAAPPAQKAKKERPREDSSAGAHTSGLRKAWVWLTTDKETVQEPFERDKLLPVLVKVAPGRGEDLQLFRRIQDRLADKGFGKPGHRPHLPPAPYLSVCFFQLSADKSSKKKPFFYMMAFLRNEWKLYLDEAQQQPNPKKIAKRAARLLYEQLASNQAAKTAPKDFARTKTVHMVLADDSSRRLEDVCPGLAADRMGIYLAQKGRKESFDQAYELLYDKGVCLNGVLQLCRIRPLSKPWLSWKWTDFPYKVSYDARLAASARQLQPKSASKDSKPAATLIAPSNRQQSPPTAPPTASRLGATPSGNPITESRRGLGLGLGVLYLGYVFIKKLLATRSSVSPRRQLRRASRHRHSREVVTRLPQPLFSRIASKTKAFVRLPGKMVASIKQKYQKARQEWREAVQTFRWIWNQPVIPVRERTSLPRNRARS